MYKLLAELSPKFFLGILLLVFSLIIAIIVNYGLLPKYKNYVDYEKSFQSLSSSLTNNINYQYEMDNIGIQVEQLQKRLNGDGIRLPFKQFESHVIGQLQKLAWNNHIELGGVTPRNGQMIDRYHEILFDVELTGEYFDLYRFLLGFESVMGFVVINELRIAPLNSENQTPLLKIAMNIASYREEQQ